MSKLRPRSECGDVLGEAYQVFGTQPERQQGVRPPERGGASPKSCATPAAVAADLTRRLPKASLADTEVTPWDRIAELLIELALEHDPAIIEPISRRSPDR
jgi:hypothetical protein